MSAAELSALEAHYAFDRRHIGPSEAEIAEMLKLVGAKSLTELAARTVPAATPAATTAIQSRAQRDPR